MSHADWHGLTGNHQLTTTNVPEYACGYGSKFARVAAGTHSSNCQCTSSAKGLGQQTDAFSDLSPEMVLPQPMERERIHWSMRGMFLLRLGMLPLRSRMHITISRQKATSKRTKRPWQNRRTKFTIAFDDTRSIWNMKCSCL